MLYELDELFLFAIGADLLFRTQGHKKKDIQFVQFV